MPITVLVYFLLTHFSKYTMSKMFLILSSMIFLACFNWYTVFVLTISILVNYLINLWIMRGRRKLALIFGLIFNVGYLAVFKYSGFILENMTGRGMTSFGILFPVGISFYTFQQIAFQVDNYRGEISKYSSLDYILFTTFFPKMIQGPISYHSELFPQFNDIHRKRFSVENFSKGLMLFSLGLGKKVLLADNFGKIVDYGFSSISSLNSFEALLTVLAYTLQIYLDFSGYCDMAVGTAKMLNIDLPQNFNSPYKAKNISQFWKCWHMTLTRFLTKYIYIPLGGNRKGIARTCINIIIVYLISGIWHGTGYTFIIWGLMHGIATVLYRLFNKSYDYLPNAVQWLINFCFISVTWVFFRAPSVTSATKLLRQILVGGWKFAINAELTETLLMPTLINIPSQFLPFPIVITVLFIGTIWGCATFRNSNQMVEEFRPSFLNWCVTYFLLVIGILSLSGVSTFLYTNF